MDASARNRVLYALLAIVLVVLVVEIAIWLPRLLQVWKPFDYGNYVAMGIAVRQGLNPYGAHQYYPFPTVLWIFVPLSFLPEAFRLVWILGPFISILILFRKPGIGLFLYTPLWLVVGDGMLDGWLLVPLAWLLENRPIWGGLGAALLLFKPQLAWLAVGYMVLRWSVGHDWKNLGVFATAMLVLCIPSFIINPNWVAQMVNVLTERAAHTTSLFPLLAGSIWSWWWLGDWARAIFLILLVLVLGLFVRALLHAPSRAAALHLINLALNPIFFGSTMIMVAPVLREREQMLVSVAVSLGAFVLDRQLGGFGGGYALLPLCALYWQGNASTSKSAGECPAL